MNKMKKRMNEIEKRMKWKKESGLKEERGWTKWKKENETNEMK